MFADVFAALVAHCGGESVISEPRRELCRRAALLEVELICVEADLARLRSKAGIKLLSKQTTLAWLDLYSRMAGNQRRILETIGLDRIARDITPSLSTYIRQIEAAEVVE